MERVHLEHAERLAAIVAQYGWPGVERVGADGEEAAWLILQHAISDPHFQREGLRRLKEAAERGDAPWYQVALLEDRIRFNAGRAQLYGTQLDWDENGQLSPLPGIEDPSRLEERRRAVGLGPFEAEIARKRKAAAQWGEKPPSDLGEHRRKMEAWARKVGWR
ncbi:MAG TPA: DUF6624 domain-containing protein, partial [Vicinamibacteria bacterium]|nr:DUF6624 domain-containing protein [Vicinamibacteria bacterium]